MTDFFQAFLQNIFPDNRLIWSLLVATSLLGAFSGVVGCFAFLRKRALVGDAVAHAILPGVCLGYLLAGSQKNTFFLFAGAVAAGWISLLSINFITHNSKLKTDAAIGIVLSVFFGMGILLLTHIQSSGAGNQSGLDKFIFGKAAAMTMHDVQLIYVVAAVVVAIVTLFYREFTVLSFDPAFAQSIGLPRKFMEFILATLTVVTVAVGIQTVGVVLMAALLITPAAAARFWVHRLRPMMLLAASFGGVSAWLGGVISLSAPSMPTGPWIVVVLSALALLSLFFTPKRGLLMQYIKQQQMRRKMLRENILKTMYHLGENGDYERVQLSEQDMLAKREYQPQELHRGLNMLKNKKLAEKTRESWQLTSAGEQAAARIVRLHRLWELYLNKRLRLAPDHVHHDAEAIEHIITPEIEAQLISELNEPTTDPHNSQIPQA